MRAIFLFVIPAILGSPIQDEGDDVAFLNEMVGNLFVDRDGREIEVDVEGADIATNLASDEVNIEKAVDDLVQELDPAEIARFNNYMDAIYRRMNAALRAKLMDPMILNLNEKKEKSKTKHNNKKERRQGRDADLEEVEDEEEDDVDRSGLASEEEKEDGESRKMKKEKKHKKKEGKKNKEAHKKKRQEERRANKKHNKAEKHHKSKNGKGKKERKSGKEKKGQKHTEKGQKHNEKEKKLERTRRNKHSDNDKKKVKSSKNVAEKTMGSLSGIATLRRFGDVIIMNSDNHKVVKSEFTIGPLQLEVSKTQGHGQSRSVKTAKAVTDELTGKMVLKVKSDGSAHVKSVFFKRPGKVEVRGSLGNQKERSDTYLRNSVGKVRPMAAQRILKMARYVLKSPSNVVRS